MWAFPVERRGVGRVERSGARLMPAASQGFRLLLRVGRVDNCYGILAGVIIVVGFIRASVAAKGWAYYEVNVFFWAKIATFLIVGLLSIVPTVAIIRWRNALKSDAAFAPPSDAIRPVRGYLWAEAALFLLLPVFAAAMARGYGELTP
jgi:putative membrane protein